MNLRIGSTFSGYGGLDLAVLDVLGGELAWHCENDPAGSTVLAHHWPTVPNLGDITTVDWKEVRAMAAPRHDEKACQMYMRYQQGLSLAQVAAEFGCTRQSVYGVFKTRDWELRPQPGARKTVEFQGRLYSLRNTGYYGCTTGDRHLLHRAVWEHHNGTIPVDYDIHHRDEDKTNNELSNLECLPKSEHTRLYSPSCNQYSHKCGCDQEVMPEEAPAIDVLTGGFPIRRVRTSASLAEAPESKGPEVDSGGISRTPFAYYDPESSCWRTWQHSLFEDLTESSPSWPTSGMTCGGRAYVLRTSARHIAATDGSPSHTLPTPAAARSGNNQSPSPGASVRPSLDSITHLLPTPDATHGRKTTRTGPLLPGVVENLLPTVQHTARNHTANRSSVKPTTNNDGWTLLDVFWNGDPTSPPSVAGNTPSATKHPSPLWSDGEAASS